ncbi:Rpn family recombination-promoting nuclease/putative transposase [Planctomycetaceae bacterium SH139]
MTLGIKPTVDFAFKKIFGSPENATALIGLLNAILALSDKIVSVQILNPFNFQEFAESKQIVLDVRCRDCRGRYFNVEMQVSVYAGLVQRLAYYACSMHLEQLSKGENYASLTPSVSICLLSRVLFPQSAQAHHRFEMLDRESGRKLENAIEVHTVELSKYNLAEGTISKASNLERWAFLLLRAQDYEAAMLKRLLPGIEFETAIETIEIISAKTEDKQMYDQREKAQRDFEWAISGARKEGREEGREEGKLAGQIQLIQELLGEPRTTDAELQELDTAALSGLLAGLQQQLRNRQS